MSSEGARRSRNTGLPRPKSRSRLIPLPQQHDVGNSRTDGPSEGLEAHAGRPAVRVQQLVHPPGTTSSLHSAGDAKHEGCAQKTVPHVVLLALSRGAHGRTRWRQARPDPHRAAPLIRLHRIKRIRIAGEDVITVLEAENRIYEEYLKPLRDEI